MAYRKLVCIISNTRCVRNVPWLGSRKIYFKPKLQVFTLEVIFLESNVLSEPSQPQPQSLLEGFSRDPPSLPRQGFCLRIRNGTPYKLLWHSVFFPWPGSVGCSGHREQACCPAEAATGCSATAIACNTNPGTFPTHLLCFCSTRWLLKTT